MTALRAEPRPDELAVVRLHTGDVVTVVTAEGERTVNGDRPIEVDGESYELTTALTIPFDGPRVGWHAGGWMSGGVKLGNGRQRMDRPFWKAAEKLLEVFPVIYVQMTEEPYYRTTRWTPTGIRAQRQEENP